MMIMHLTTGILFYGIILILVLINIRKRDIKDIFWIVSSLIYTFMLIDVTIFPIPVTWAAIQSDIKYRQPISNSIQLIPDLNLYILTSRNFLLNILMTMPFSFLVNKLFIKSHRLKETFKYGFLLSVSIELIQLLMMVLIGSRRIIDVNDVIANTTGALIGLVFYKIYDFMLTTILSKSNK